MEITIAELRITPEARQATLRDQVLALTPGEFAILLSLAKAKGRVKTRDHLSIEIHDREYQGFDRAIDVQVSALRRKLGEDPRHPRFIRTIRSAGYMLVEPAVPYGQRVFHEDPCRRPVVEHPVRRQPATVR